MSFRRRVTRKDVLDLLAESRAIGNKKFEQIQSGEIGPLHPLSPEDEAVVAAFIGTMEEKRIAGEIKGWSVAKDDITGCRFSVLFHEGPFSTACGETFRQAQTTLAADMIQKAMEGAPDA